MREIQKAVCQCNTGSFQLLNELNILRPNEMGEIRINHSLYTNSVSEEHVYILQI